jgi:hypothetical protein
MLEVLSEIGHDSRTSAAAGSRLVPLDNTQGQRTNGRPTMTSSGPRQSGSSRPSGRLPNARRARAERAREPRPANRDRLARGEQQEEEEAAGGRGRPRREAIAPRPRAPQRGRRGHGRRYAPPEIANAFEALRNEGNPAPLAAKPFKAKCHDGLTQDDKRVLEHERNRAEAKKLLAKKDGDSPAEAQGDALSDPPRPRPRPREPRVESSKVRGAPGIGLTRNVTLRFERHVSGPRLLGRTRFRGGGLFVAVPYSDQP